MKKLDAEYVFEHGAREDFKQDPRATYEAYALLAGRPGLNDLKRRFEQLTFELKEITDELEEIQLMNDEEGCVTFERSARTKVLQEQETRWTDNLLSFKAAIKLLGPDRNQQLWPEIREIDAAGRVIAIGTYEESFAALVRADCVFEGSRYDMGDWLIYFTNPVDKIDEPIHRYFTVIEVRSTVLPQWLDKKNPPTAYPYYGWGSSQEWSFCFGANGLLIADLVQQGDIYQAVVVAADVMSAVNKQHREAIPWAFPKVLPAPHGA